MRYAPSCPAHPFGRHTAQASSVCSFTREVGGGRTVIGRRGVIVAMLALALAGCDGTAVSSAQPNVLESDAEANVGITASPTPTGHPKPQATAEPTPTPPPVPRKPTGVTFRFHNEVLQGGPGDTDGIGDYILKVTWGRPRRKGTEIRVYGVTKCF